MTTCFELFIRFTVRVLCGHFQFVSQCTSFLSELEGGLWDLIVMVSGHCLSFLL